MSPPCPPLLGRVDIVPPLPFPLLCQNVGRVSNWFKKKPEEMRGSVTAWDVLTATERQYGVRLHESHLMMDAPITTFGTFKVPLNLRTREDR